MYWTNTKLAIKTRFFKAQLGSLHRQNMFLEVGIYVPRSCFESTCFSHELAHPSEFSVPLYLTEEVSHSIFPFVLFDLQAYYISSPFLDCFKKNKK